MTSSDGSGAGDAQGEEAARHSGSCLCKAVTFVAKGAPKGVAACHCRNCRRQTGAPFAVYVDYPVAQVEFGGLSPAEFQSSPGAWRGFCTVCGSTLYYRGDNLPGMIHLHVGAFDRPELFAPATHESIEHRLAWLDRI